MLGQCRVAFFFVLHCDVAGMTAAALSALRSSSSGMAPSALGGQPGTRARNAYTATAAEPCWWATPRWCLAAARRTTTSGSAPSQRPTWAAAGRSRWVPSTRRWAPAPARPQRQEFWATLDLAALSVSKATVRHAPTHKNRPPAAARAEPAVRLARCHRCRRRRSCGWAAIARMWFGWAASART